MEKFLQGLDRVERNCNQEGKQGGQGNGDDAEQQRVQNCRTEGIPRRDDGDKVVDTELKRFAADGAQTVVIVGKCHNDGVDDGVNGENQQQYDAGEQVNPTFPRVEMQLFPDKVFTECLIDPLHAESLPNPLYAKGVPNPLYTKGLPKPFYENGVEEIKRSAHNCTSK